MTNNKQGKVMGRTEQDVRDNPTVGDIVGDSFGTRTVTAVKTYVYRTTVHYRHRSHLGSTWSRSCGLKAWQQYVDRTNKFHMIPKQADGPGIDIASVVKVSPSVEYDNSFEDPDCHQFWHGDDE